MQVAALTFEVYRTEIRAAARVHTAVGSGWKEVQGLGGGGGERWCTLISGACISAGAPCCKA